MLPEPTSTARPPKRRRPCGLRTERDDDTRARASTAEGPSERKSFDAPGRSNPRCSGARPMNE
eukprot:6006655-Alexandrium_andersonii.AAC.1